MGRKALVLVLVIAAVVLLGAGIAVASEENGSDEYPQVKVGGHIKMVLFERPVGTVSGRTGKVETKTMDAKYYGVSFRELNIFLSGRVSEIIGFEVDPKFSGSTGATPKLVTTTPTAGSPSDYAFTGFGHGKAVVTAQLPYDISLEAGFLHSHFTADYGGQLSWEDLQNLTKFAANDNCGSVHDAGIQLEKTFNFGDVSVPVYFYILNGGSTYYQVDVNNSPGFMMHVEPSWSGLTLLGSVYGTRYDAKELLGWTKWTAGVMYQWEGLAFRSEFVRGKKERSVMGQDANTDGYYMNLEYKVFPWLKVFARHESVHDDFYDGSKDYGTRYITNIPGAVIFLSDSTLIQFQLDIYDWRTSNNWAKVVMTRPTLGLRLTF